MTILSLKPSKQNNNFIDDTNVKNDKKWSYRRVIFVSLFFSIIMWAFIIGLLWMIF